LLFGYCAVKCALVSTFWIVVAVCPVQDAPHLL
jgi:hypothetical protein